MLRGRCCESRLRERREWQDVDGSGQESWQWSSDYGDVLLHVGKMGKKFTMVGTVIRRKIWKQKKFQF